MRSTKRQLRNRPHPRRGITLVVVAIGLMALFGLLGLVIDGGLLMSSQRQAQNAADAAARACAKQVARFEATGGDISGVTGATLLPTATLYALTYNGVPVDSAPPSGGQIVVNHPPTTGPYASGTNRYRYVEVFVTYPLDTVFMQVTGTARHRQITARAVAGYELEQRGAGLVVLDPRGNPGLSVSGTNANLTVGTSADPDDGNVYVYSLRGGVDEFGQKVVGDGVTDPINPGQPAATIGGGATLTADHVYVSGGVDVGTNFGAGLDAGGLTPVFDPFHVDAGQLNPGPPPSAAVYLAVPIVGNGAVNRDLGSVSVSSGFDGKGLIAPNSFKKGNIGGTTTLYPGIYSNISITGGEVVLNPGIYVLRPTSGTGSNILTINGGTVTGTNVMFYNTGSTYSPAAANGNPAGYPDTTDLSRLSNYAPTSSDVSGQQFGGIDIHGSGVTLTPIDMTKTGANYYSLGVGQGGPVVPAVSGTAIAPFHKMLIYQRRFNTQAMHITDGLPITSGGLQGILYAKWANLQLAGSGTYNFATVVGTMSVSGNATFTASNSLPYPPIIRPVFLVQ